ncbi:NAD(P)H-quinone oxidoreductase [Stackebrandtia soli]|uniref:NAD(P)H-quinone oxidoreductase n=1 Tax=Stackebrandtia soli TaxID=1892856 RepID=UPI0039E7D44F
MDAILITEPGGPDVLTVAELDDPEYGAGDVVIEVAAAGVNRADLLQRQGHYPPPPGAPEHPGLECSGTIAAVGSEAHRWRVGDEVCALLPGGGYATKVVVDAGLVLPVPAGVPLVDAAGLPEVAATVWSNLVDVARIRAGDRLLVHGGSGGIGTFAIQFARAFGAASIVTTTRAGNRDAVMELGADVVVDYRDEDFVEACRELGGVDIILDNMGASYLDRNIAALDRNGRILTIGLQGGATTKLNLGALLGKCATLHGTGLRGRPLTERISVIAGVEQDVWPLLASGTIRPVVAQRLPLAEAAEAHRFIEAGGHVGKVLLTT